MTLAYREHDNDISNINRLHTNWLRGIVKISVSFTRTTKIALKRLTILAVSLYMRTLHKVPGLIFFPRNIIKCIDEALGQEL